MCEIEPDVVREIVAENTQLREQIKKVQRVVEAFENQESCNPSISRQINGITLTRSKLGWNLYDAIKDLEGEIQSNKYQDNHGPGDKCFGCAHHDAGCRCDPDGMCPSGFTYNMLRL